MAILKESNNVKIVFDDKGENKEDKRKAITNKEEFQKLLNQAMNNTNMPRN